MIYDERYKTFAVSSFMRGHNKLDRPHSDKHLNPLLVGSEWSYSLTRKD
jgi:hypothetical protein